MSFFVTRMLKAFDIVLIVLLISLTIININCRQPQQNPYDVLQISHSSNQQEVKQRFRELSRVYHPDKLKLQNLSDDLLTQSQKKFQQIASAYEFIKSKDFNPRIVNRFYNKQQSFYGSKSPQYYHIYKDHVNREMFREFYDYEQFQQKAQQEERLRKIEGDGLYAKLMGFIRYMIRNSMMTLGVFFVSLGMFVLFSCGKSKENQPIKKSTQLHCSEKIAKPDTCQQTYGASK